MVFEYVETKIPLDMDERNIDRTHIVALKEENGLLRNMELPITRPEQFIAELQAMIGNSNRSVWDMQSLFTTRFPKTKGYLDYIQPHSYKSSYISGIRYPRLYEYSELRSSWEQAGKSARGAYHDSCNQNGTNPDASIAAQKETEAVNLLKKGQKSNFFSAAMRWIDASCYYHTANQLNRDNTVKMFSKENIGWSHFTHRVNEEINVSLRTNFGFGSAAHFILSVQYKGFDILPYSYIVKYYKAGMADIVRCTRSYSPCRESWSASFDFLSDFVNKSIADPRNFVESYIMQEVVEMMQGLEAIALNPKGFLEHIGNRKADPCVINVRPMFSDDKIRMQSYPDETPILFKVEKITGALDFLNSLTAIAKEVKTVQPHIDRLLEINMMLFPEVQDAIAKINKKVEKQTVVKSELNKQIAALSEKLTLFEEEITRLRAEATQKNHPFNLNDYEILHPEYVSLKSKKSDVQSQLHKVNRLIGDFNSFLSFLNRSLIRIEEVKQLKEAA